MVLQLNSDLEAARAREGELQELSHKMSSKIEDLQKQLVALTTVQQPPPPLVSAGSRVAGSLHSDSYALQRSSSSASASCASEVRHLPPPPPPQSEDSARSSSRGGTRRRRASCSETGGAYAPSSTHSDNNSSSNGMAMVSPETKAYIAKAMTSMQTELSDMRHKYAQRLVAMESNLFKAEAAAQEAVSTCERLFQQLVNRTASLLAGRLGAGALTGPLQSGSYPFISTSAPDHSSQPLIPRPMTPSKRASMAAASAGNPQLAVLHAMNDKLSTENAGLLAELAKYATGKHPMLRKMGLTVLGQGDASSTTMGGGTLQSAPASNHLQPTASHAKLRLSSDGRPPTPGAGAASGTASSVTPAPSVSNVCVPNPVKDALAVAAKELLLCGRKELLPLVMIGEGWALDHSQPGRVWLSKHSKADESVSAAETHLQVRATNLALQVSR
jgi:hypothetical protein